MVAGLLPAAPTTTGERLGPTLGDRLGELRLPARTPEEEEEYRLLYLRSDLADPHDLELARHIHRTERLFPGNAAVRDALNGELKEGDLPLQRSRCLAVTVPVLVVSGGADPPPQAALGSLVDALADVTWSTIDGAGHWPWLEEPEQTRHILTRFLSAGTCGPLWSDRL